MLCARCPIRTTGTFGIIIPTGIIVGALLGWAEHQRRTGTQYPLLILAPLLIGIIPNLAAGPDPGPIGLALLAMAGGYAVSGRGPLWTRIVAGIVNLTGIAVTFLAPKPYPDLSYTTPHGAWFDTLAASLGVTLALACSIPMRRPDTSHNPAGQKPAADIPDHRPTPSASIVGEPAVHDPPASPVRPARRSTFTIPISKSAWFRRSPASRARASPAAPARPATGPGVIAVARTTAARWPRSGSWRRSGGRPG
jgi:hypothetical protein